MQQLEPIVRFGSVDVARRITAADVATLKRSDVEMDTFTEGGQFYVVGWQGNRRVVYACCDPREFDMMMHPERMMEKRIRSDRRFFG